MPTLCRTTVNHMNIFFQKRLKLTFRLFSLIDQGFRVMNSTYFKSYTILNWPEFELIDNENRLLKPKVTYPIIQQDIELVC